MTVTIAPPGATAAAGDASTTVPADSVVRGQLAPGADAPFIWSAYGLSLIVLMVLWWRSQRLLRRAGEIGARDERKENAEEKRL